nr:unnamed protein product [Callosobruchus chinensis]
MATEKYRLPSPYSRPRCQPPKEDTVYIRHLDDLACNVQNVHVELGVAIFGIGRAGTIHLTNLVGNRRAHILYIVDDDIEKLQRLKIYWNLKNTTCITSKQQDQALKDPKVNFIVCASPTFTHENIVKQAIAHKKAVFCEKPIAETIEKAANLYELARKAKVPLLSAFNRRFDASYKSVRDRVRAGEVGKVLTVKVCSRDSPLPSLEYLKISGGIFHDCAVHDIDQIISVLGEYPIKVCALATSNIPEIANINDVDTVAISMQFKSGAVAAIDLSRQCNYGYDQRLEVFGEKGMIKAENRCPMQSVEHFLPDRIEGSPIYYSFASRYQEAYRQEMEHFIDVLQGKCNLMIDGKDLLAVSKIATACEKSFKTGSIVDLKWSPEELPQQQ